MGLMEYDEDEEDFRGSGFLNEMDFFTWDLIVKNTPKLTQVELLLHKNLLRHKKFFVNNEYQYNVPFMIFYSGS